MRTKLFWYVIRSWLIRFVQIYIYVIIDLVLMNSMLKITYIVDIFWILTKVLAKLEPIKMENVFFSKENVWNTTQ